MNVQSKLTMAGIIMLTCFPLSSNAKDCQKDAGLNQPVVSSAPVGNKTVLSGTKLEHDFSGLELIEHNKPLVQYFTNLIDHHPYSANILNTTESIPWAQSALSAWATTGSANKPQEFVMVRQLTKKDYFLAEMFRDATLFSEAIDKVTATQPFKANATSGDVALQHVFTMNDSLDHRSTYSFGSMSTINLDDTNYSVVNMVIRLGTKKYEIVTMSRGNCSNQYNPLDEAVLRANNILAGDKK